MSLCRNLVSRIIYPLVNKQYFYKNTVVPWNIILHQKYERINSFNTLHGNNINQEQCRHFHLSNTFNNIIPYNLSDIGEGIREVVVKEWYVKVGDKIAQFDNICEVQSDKASVTISSRYDGVITKLYHDVNDIALVGKPLVDIDTLQTDSTASKNEVKNIETAGQEKLEIPVKETTASKEILTENTTLESDNVSNRGLAIPSVRRIAKENKINLADVKGTGKGGRVLKEDIINYLNKQSVSTASNEYSEPVRGFTRAMIKTMTEAMKIPHFVYHDEVRATNLVKLREKLKQKDLKITFLPFFIKATSNGLSKYPIINSRLDATQENIIFNKSHNIAIAMDTPTGLVVPVIKDVQNKSILEISKEIARLQVLGKQSKFSKEDLSDGTFTFSNIGAIGGTYAKPIILPPQSAIIALGAFKNVPRFSKDGSIIKETVCFISAAADHRIIDGATMARFCNVLKEQIEDPEFLFLNA